MRFERSIGVPAFEAEELSPRKTKYCLCIPIINENGRIQTELERGGSTDGCTNIPELRRLGVNALLTKRDVGQQGAQLRMAFWWCLRRGYEGIITVDGNNKDSIESVPLFIEKLDEGYDFVQGSRFLKGGSAVNTPISRYLAVRCIHAPLISMSARHRFTDTTNAFRAHSKRYLEDPRVLPFRDNFLSYELLAYLSVRGAQIGLRVCEVPVSRIYPERDAVPTKISPFRGNQELLRILAKTIIGGYKP